MRDMAGAACNARSVDRGRRCGSGTADEELGSDAFGSGIRIRWGSSRSKVQ